MTTNDRLYSYETWKLYVGDVAMLATALCSFSDSGIYPASAAEPQPNFVELKEEWEIKE